MCYLTKKCSVAQYFPWWSFSSCLFCQAFYFCWFYACFQSVTVFYTPPVFLSPLFPSALPSPCRMSRNTDSSDHPSFQMLEFWALNRGETGNVDIRARLFRELKIRLQGERGQDWKINLSRGGLRKPSLLCNSTVSFWGRAIYLSSPPEPWSRQGDFSHFITSTPH